MVRATRFNYGGGGGGGGDNAVSNLKLSIIKYYSKIIEYRFSIDIAFFFILFF
jgi:hypothetical protein